MNTRRTRTLIPAAAFIWIAATALHAQGPPGPSPNLRQPNRAQANMDPEPERPVAEIIEGLYISRFQEDIGVSDEQFTRILPMLRQNLRERREFGERRTRALARLRQMIQSNAEEDELKRQLREVDRSESDAATLQQSFVAKVDPILTTAQQARLRVFQMMIDQRVRRMIDRVRAPNARQPQ